MKKFFEMMEKDILEEGFTRRECIVVGIVAPLALIGLCVLPGVLTEMLLKLVGLN